jgi:hypothetical protein
MNKKIFIALLLCIWVGSCEEDDENPVKKNAFTFSGETHTAAEGIQQYYGHYEDFGDAANNISLIIPAGDLFIAFEMFVPNGETELVEGTYTKKKKVQPYAFIAGYILEEDFKNVLYEIISGTVHIGVSQNTYTIDVDCTLDDDSKLTGNYTGPLEWYDESEDDRTYPGNLTVQTGSGETQTYHFGQGTQRRMSTTGGYLYMLTFLPVDGNEFGVGFLLATTSATLPVGTYPTESGFGNTFGISTASLKLAGSAGIKNSSSNGSFTVAKNGTVYTLTFSYTTTDKPTETITGTYVGELPVQQ